MTSLICRFRGHAWRWVKCCDGDCTIIAAGYNCYAPRVCTRCGREG